MPIWTLCLCLCLFLCLCLCLCRCLCLYLCHMSKSMSLSLFEFRLEFGLVLKLFWGTWFFSTKVVLFFAQLKLKWCYVPHKHIALVNCLDCPCLVFVQSDSFIGQLWEHHKHPTALGDCLDAGHCALQRSRGRRTGKRDADAHTGLTRTHTYTHSLVFIHSILHTHTYTRAFTNTH